MCTGRWASVTPPAVAGNAAADAESEGFTAGLAAPPQPPRSSAAASSAMVRLIRPPVDLLADGSRPHPVGILRGMATTSERAYEKLVADLSGHGVAAGQMFGKPTL